MEIKKNLKSGLWIKKYSPYAVTNFKIQKYYQNEPRFNGVLSRDDLPNKAKDGTL